MSVPASPKASAPPVEANDEIFALIETLLQTERRLDELTGGEVAQQARNATMFFDEHPLYLVRVLQDSSLMMPAGPRSNPAF